MTPLDEAAGGGKKRERWLPGNRLRDRELVLLLLGEGPPLNVTWESLPVQLQVLSGPVEEVEESVHNLILAHTLKKHAHTQRPLHTKDSSYYIIVFTPHSIFLQLQITIPV